MTDQTDENKSSNAMWGGRFADGPSAIMREINASIPFDKALWREDIAGSRAHVAMLAKQGIVSEADAKAIEDRKNLHHNKCGKCGGTMHPKLFKGVEIDICEDCGSVLLDPGELEELAGEEGTAGTSIIPPPPPGERARE